MLSSLNSIDNVDKFSVIFLNEEFSPYVVESWSPKMTMMLKKKLTKLMFEFFILMWLIQTLSLLQSKCVLTKNIYYIKVYNVCSGISTENSTYGKHWNCAPVKTSDTLLFIQNIFFSFER